MTAFTPISALVGGVMIGLSAAMLYVTIGRMAGISGIVGGLLKPAAGDWPWRLAFVAGLIIAPPLFGAFGGEVPPIEIAPSLGPLILGGLLVGFGTRLGSGCTSGHGVCGLARLSPRSLAATAVFLIAGLATVFAVRHMMGG
jgi:uncharacterized membrane protein YedE/YeeE